MGLAVFKINVWTYADMFTNVRKAGSGKRSYLVKEGKMFIKDET